MTHSPSQHSQTQGSSWAINTQHWLLGQPKKDETTHQIFFSVDMSARFPWIILPHLLRCLCVQSAPSSYAPLWSISIVLWICPWCDPGHTRGQRLLNKESPAVRKVQVPAHIHTPASLHWQNNAKQCQQSLTVQQVIHALPGLPWPSPQHDDIHPLVLLWRPPVPANSKLSFRN